MKQQQASAGAASSATQKVDSPLAKYTTNGDLACILCKVPVKSSVAWNAHCATPQHKQGLELLLQKKKQQKTAASAPLPADRDEDEPSAKRAKLAESESVEAHKSEASMPDIAPSGPLPSADEPEEPQISNEEILRQLRYAQIFCPLCPHATSISPIYSQIHHFTNSYISVSPS